MPIEVAIKPALVKTSDYSLITDPILFMDYMNDCIRIGKLATLYKDPNITTAFYDAGTMLSGLIQSTVDTYNDAPIDSNKELVEVAMANGLVWMNSYASKVEVIANLPANRVTQAQAAVNISQSNLTYQALTQVSKGTPVSPDLAGKVGTGPGAVDVSIINVEPFNPSRTLIVSVQQPLLTDPITPPANVTVVGDQMNIQTFGPTNISIKIIPGKGRLARFKALVTGVFQDFYGFCSNGKNKNSTLSPKITVKL